MKREAIQNPNCELIHSRHLSAWRKEPRCTGRKIMRRQVNKLGQQFHWSQSLFGINSGPSSLISYRNYLPPHVCDNEKITPQHFVLQNNRKLLLISLALAFHICTPATYIPSVCEPGRRPTTPDIWYTHASHPSETRKAEID